MEFVVIIIGKVMLVHSVIGSAAKKGSENFLFFCINFNTSPQLLISDYAKPNC